MSRINVVEQGHVYELKNFTSEDYQIIQFVNKTFHTETGELEGYVDGTTNEAVLEMLIDRMKHLNGIFPSSYNVETIAHLEKALQCLEERTHDRIQRGVEGEAKP